MSDALQTLADEPDPIKARITLTKRAASAAGGRCTPFIFHEDFKSDFNTNCLHYVAQKNRLYCGLQSGELLEVDLDNGQVHNRWKLAELLICGVQYVPSTGRLHVATKALEMLTVDPASGAVLKRTRLAEGVSAWRLLYVEQLGSFVCGLNTGEVVLLDAATATEKSRATVHKGSTVQAVRHCADTGLIFAAVCNARRARTACPCTVQRLPVQPLPCCRAAAETLALFEPFWAQTRGLWSPSTMRVWPNSGASS